jgi:hypothetical protein
MSMTCKTNLQIVAIGTHFARLMLLLNGSWTFRTIVVFFSWPLDALYSILFLIDFIPFLMFWFMRSEWEFAIRTIGLFWLIILGAILLPWGAGPGLLVVFCIQFLVLIWPKPYISTPEHEEVTDVKNLFQTKCINCGATYAYNLDSIINQEVVCQNCGKSFKV